MWVFIKILAIINKQIGSVIFTQLQTEWIPLYQPKIWRKMKNGGVCTFKTSVFRMYGPASYRVKKDSTKKWSQSELAAYEDGGWRRIDLIMIINKNNNDICDEIRRSRLPPFLPSL